MPKTLLVVDDSATIREAAKLALTGEAWFVTEATSSDEALSAIRSGSPDAVLCDVSLAGEDGYEVCRAIRELPEGAGVPVVLMGSKVSEAAARAAGAVGTLPKPFSSDELVEALGTTLGAGTFELELSDLELASAAPQAGAAAERALPGVEDREELEIIDLSSDEEYEELELLEDLEPVALTPAPAAAEQGSELALGDLENFPGLTGKADEGSSSDERPLADVHPTQERSSGLPELDLAPFGDEPEPVETRSSTWDETPLEGAELPDAELGEGFGEDSFVAGATERDDVGEAVERAAPPVFSEEDEPQPFAAPGTDLLTDSVARAAAEAVRAALESSLSAERLVPAVEAVVERVVWEVVPPLAERLIQEAIERLRQEPPES